MSKIRIKHFEHEIEVEGDNAFIKSYLDDFYKKIKFSSQTPVEINFNENMETATTPPSLKKEITPAEFFMKITNTNKTEGINQILIFGKYLEEILGKTEFTKKEINNVVKQARLAKDIHPQYFTNAVKQGLLRASGSGKYSLTLSAETAFSSIMA
jgi:hypothetical protein